MNLLWRLTPKAEQNPEHKEWIIKNPSGDIVAILDYQTGNLQILGELKRWDDSVRDNSRIKKFMVRSSSTNDTSVFMIDQSGNLYMKGALLENAL